MHKKIEKVLGEDLDFIKNTLLIKFADSYKEKYQLVLTNLAKIKHDESSPDGYQFFKTIYAAIQKITEITRENTDWNDTIAEVAFLLDRRHEIYKEQSIDFANQESEEVYRYLIGEAESEG